ELEHAEQLAMIDLNVRVLAELSLAFIDSLSRHRGGILNVASVASFLPGPGMAVYYASKAFVLSFSESLHQELLDRGIRVTTLCPGVVPTEFQARAGMKKIPGSGLFSTSPADVAAAGYAALMQGQRVLVPGIVNKFVTFVPRILPRGFFLRAVARSQLRQRNSSLSS
ncbi:MAG TPA: SDR family NAD(P)-dependent oxidoreductase, partial [Xanthobacteraceae bacterium]|nr:SDR family NAD(P)-dependent oxidoreductase [Xanthobacteraceae bacterium]